MIVNNTSPPSPRSKSSALSAKTAPQPAIAARTAPPVASKPAPIASRKVPATVVVATATATTHSGLPDLTQMGSAGSFHFFGAPVLVPEIALPPTGPKPADSRHFVDVMAARHSLEKAAPHPSVPPAARPVQTAFVPAIAPRAAGNQGLIVRAFRRFAALGSGDAAAAERSAAGRAFDARVTFIPAPFPRVNAAGDAAAVDHTNPHPAGKVVLLVAESPEAAAGARAAAPSVAPPSPLAAGAATPHLDALLLQTQGEKEDTALGFWAAEDVVTAWVGPWKP